jgi:hypothetical protein
MNNRQAAQETRNITVCEFLAVPANAAIYAANVGFSTSATKMQTDSAAAVIAGTNAAADNTGYSLDKSIAKEAVSQMAAQLCASSIVQLLILGNNALAKSLNGTVTYYFAAKDAISTVRLMSVYNTMTTNLALITPAYLTAAQLATFLTLINTYTTTKGSSTLINNNSPVLTKTFDTAMKLTSADVATIKELAKFYKKTQPVFYAGIMKACKMPAITVRHTPVVLNVTNASDGSVLSGAESMLTKSKELLTSNIYGVIKYVKVSAGSATGTISKVGFITRTLPMEIVRGVTNTFNVALVPGIMTAEQEEAIKATIAQVIADEKAIIAAKKKAKKDAKEATVAANMPLVVPVIETVVAEPKVETGDAATA